MTPETLVRICKGFWKPSTDQKEATISLALKHLLFVDHGRTKDWSRNEARYDPLGAVYSLSNYVFFAEEIQRGELP